MTDEAIKRVFSPNRDSASVVENLWLHLTPRHAAIDTFTINTARRFLQTCGCVHPHQTSTFVSNVHRTLLLKVQAKKEQTCVFPAAADSLYLCNKVKKSYNVVKIRIRQQLTILDKCCRIFVSVNFYIYYNILKLYLLML